MWLDAIAQNVDLCYIDIWKTNGQRYTANVSAVATIVSDLKPFYNAIIVITFTTPNDFPNWSDINLDDSILEILNESTYTSLLQVRFNFLDQIGLTFGANEQVNLTLTLPGLTFQMEY